MTNDVPGSTERDAGYWRDVGTIDAYFDAHMDLRTVDPMFNLYNNRWPILTHMDPLPPAKFVHDNGDRVGRAIDSLVSNGVIVSGGLVRESVLSPGVRVNSWSTVDRAVLLHNVIVGRHAEVRDAIIDKNVVVPEGAKIGVDKEHDRARGFVVSPGGITVVGKGQDGAPVKVALLTREYPPEVYGGAGVHVEYLARALSGLVDLTVHCQGAPRDTAVAHQAWPVLHDAALKVFSADLSMADAVAGADLVHSHTWYANLAGHLASLLHGIPHVATVHSLEPLRPWKAEQLGGGYALSSWAERVSLASAAAVVAVSDGMRSDVLSVYPEISPERVRVIRNGIDTLEYAPDPGTDVLEKHGVDPSRPYVIFVGRITRQKGVPVLLRAAASLDPSAQLVLCAGAADTPELGAEVASLVAELQSSRSGRALDPGDAAEGGDHPAADACPGVRVPVGLRAAWHRQPGGDGVRDRRGGVAGGRHPRGGRRGRDRAARAAGRPGVPRRRAEHAAARPGPGGRDGARRAGSGR